MRIKTTREINARTHDGRAFTASEGSVEAIDDEDVGMVGLARSLIMSGQAVHYGDAGTVDEEVASSTLEEATDDDPAVVDMTHGDLDDGDLDEDD